MDRLNELAPEPKEKKPGRKLAKLGAWPFYITIGGGFLAYYLLGRLERFTELTPRHPTAEDVCLTLGGLLGLLVAAFLFWATRRSTLSIRLRTALPLGFLVALVSFAFMHRINNIVEGHLDFPAATTKTFVSRVRIYRAYRTHGKSPSWKIETAPFWVDLDIKPSDYDFMLAHRNPDDTGTDPDHISSRGYFCAKATFQQSGQALRILNAGSQDLPAGTVVICNLLINTPTH